MMKKIIISVFVGAVCSVLSLSAQELPELHGVTKSKINSTKSDFILFESFENLTYPPEGWTLENDAPLVSARAKASDISFYPGSASYHGNYLVAFNCNLMGTKGKTAKLITKAFDASNPHTIFSMALLKDHLYSWYRDSIALKISYNGGNDWEDFGSTYYRYEECGGYYWDLIMEPITNGTANTKVSIECTSDQGLHSVLIDYVNVFTIKEHDLLVVGIEPYHAFAGHAVKPKVIIGNIGLNTENSWTVTLTDGGSYSSSVSGTALIEVGETLEVLLPEDWIPTAGTKTLTATVILNSNEDGDLSNNELSKPIQVYAVANYGGKTYAGNNNEKKYVNLDLTNGSMTEIGSFSDSPLAIAEAYNGQAIFRLHDNNSFGMVSPNGTYTALGWVKGLEGFLPRGLAYDWDNNQMYVSLLSLDGRTILCQLNMYNYQLELVGYDNISNAIIAIDFADDGYIYGPGLDGKLYRIDPATGLQTAIGNVGMNLSYVQDVSFDFETSRLYTITCGNNPSDYRFGYYNLSTGIFNEIVNYNNGQQYTTFVIAKNKDGDPSHVQTTESLNRIHIYPNPSNGLVKLSVPEKSVVKIFDITGKTIQTYNLNENSEINLTQPAGIYFIHVETNHKVFVEKLIIK